MTATTKGMFFNDLIALVKKERGKAEAEAMCRELDLPTEFRALSAYPIEDEVRLQLAVIKRLYPDKDVKQGMYELGRTSFSTFASSLLGKVGLTLLANEPRKLAQRIPDYVKMVNNFGSIDVEELDDKQVRLVYQEMREYGEHHQGILQAGIEIMGFEGTVELKVQRLEEKSAHELETDFSLLLRWQ